MVNFFEVDNTPYCELHYKQLFAERCAKCDKPILGQETKGLGKSWHPGCFVCTTCERPFPTMQFWGWEEKPYCTKCFDKLPEKIRKKIDIIVNFIYSAAAVCHVDLKVFVFDFFQ